MDRLSPQFPKYVFFRTIPEGCTGSIEGILHRALSLRASPQTGAAIRFPPVATDSHGSDIGHCLGMTRGRAATWGGPYGMGSTDTIHCRGGYDPPGVLRFAPSSVSLRSTASPLRGEAYKARLPSLHPTGGKVARCGHRALHARTRPAAQRRGSNITFRR